MHYTSETRRAGMNRQQFDALIAENKSAPHLNSIYAAIRDYKINFFVLPPDGRPLQSDMLNAAAPFTAIIGDDTDRSVGPNGFDKPSLRLLIRKATSAAVISSEIVPNIYTLMSLMSGMLRANTVIVETRPQHEMEWIRFLQDASPHIPMVVSTALPEQKKQRGSSEFYDE